MLDPKRLSPSINNGGHRNVMPSVHAQLAGTEALPARQRFVGLSARERQTVIRFFGIAMALYG
jgi:hypothetical protein